MMNLKNLFKQCESDIILIATIVLVALISFGLGRLSKIREQKTPITIENSAGQISQGLPSESVRQPAETGEGESLENLASVGAINTIPNSGKVVASKSGTKYHYPWCSGALRISETNKIYFDSESSARQAGYTPAANCKGLK